MEIISVKGFKMQQDLEQLKQNLFKELPKELFLDWYFCLFMSGIMGEIFEMLL